MAVGLLAAFSSGVILKFLQQARVASLATPDPDQDKYSDIIPGSGDPSRQVSVADGTEEYSEEEEANRDDEEDEPVTEQSEDEVVYDDGDVEMADGTLQVRWVAALGQIGAGTHCDWNSVSVISRRHPQSLFQKHLPSCATRLPRPSGRLFARFAPS